MPDSGPLSEHITWEFPARGSMPPVKLHWYDGGRQIPADLLDGRTLAKDFNGSVFVGSKGRLFVPHGGGMELMPREKFADFTPPPHTLPRPEGGHYREWIDAAKKGVAGTTGTTFDYSGPMTESVLLGNVAFRVGKRLEYDWKSMRCPNAPEAEQYIRHHYRKGWSL